MATATAERGSGNERGMLHGRFCDDFDRRPQRKGKNMEKRAFIKGVLAIGLMYPMKNALPGNFIPASTEKYNVVAFIGGAGLNTARSFYELPDVRALYDAANIKTLIIGNWEYKCGMNRYPLPPADDQCFLSESFACNRYAPFEQRLAQAKSEIAGLRETMRDKYRSLTVVAGIGAQTGTFAGGAITEMAHEENIPTCRILITPFAFEGGRNLLADELIAKTSRKNTADIILRNEDLLAELGGDATLPEAFHYQARRAAKALLNNPYFHADRHA